MKEFLSEEELKDFDIATSHDEKCDCSKCKAWWKAMPEEE